MAALELSWATVERATGPRPRTYNERQLQAGKAMPFFIWPNVNPFREFDTIAHAVPRPGSANTIAETGDLKRPRFRQERASRRPRRLRWSEPLAV
jgi:hypothetical protein